MIDYKKELNESQYEAATYIDGPLRIFAGAGSGKTRTLIYRVACMIEQGIAPEQILLLTFTNKAANEMKDRAESMLDDRCGRITACTYHSFCNSMLRRYSDRIGWNRNFTVLGKNDPGEIINLLKAESGDNKKRGFPNGAAVYSMISVSKNKERPLNEIIDTEFRKYKQYKTEINILAAKYENYKADRIMMDYDDLLIYFLQLITDHEDVRDLIAEEYKYIMVDEYQDTNDIQERIILRLREKVTNIAVVGDDYQSIYAFRGSNVNNILEFSRKMDDVKTIKLEQNYRSGQEILDLANSAMKNFATEGVYKEMRSDMNCDMPALYVMYSQLQEKDVVVSLIKKELKNGTKPEEIAVLCRKSNQSSMIEAELAMEGIPFVKYGGKTFLEREFVQDILAYLRAVANPHDELAWFRILKLYPGIGDAYAQKISRLSVDEEENFLVNNEYGSYKFYSELFSLYTTYLGWKDRVFHELLETIVDYYFTLMTKNIENADYRDEATRDEQMSVLSEEQQDVQQLIMIAEEYDTLNDFLDAIVLDGVKKKSDEGNVIVSTIHSAKGLEFETVFILDCVDGCFPSTTFMDVGKKEDNEELRCFYVAVTRAKNNLYILCPRTVRDFSGKTQMKFKSHFLNESKDMYEVHEYCG